jgi:hypothetical protein
VQVRFTRKRCPTDHATIERTHQTMTAQALLEQTYPSHSALWAGLDERRKVLNHHLRSSALAHKAPLEAYPYIQRAPETYLFVNHAFLQHPLIAYRSLLCNLQTYEE